jgi:preprotein translocase subunit SecE
MAKSENGSFWSELVAVGLYKRNQGRLARQLTAGSLAVIGAVGAYRLSIELNSMSSTVKVGIPVVLMAAGQLP